jgi:hypothetical protein
MPATDIANILSRLTAKPYITQEVIWGAGEPIQPSEYVGNGQSSLVRQCLSDKLSFNSAGDVQEYIGRAKFGMDADCACFPQVQVHDRGAERVLGRRDLESAKLRESRCGINLWASTRTLMSASV